METGFQPTQSNRAYYKKIVIIIVGMTVAGLLCYGALVSYKKNTFLKTRLDKLAYSSKNNQAYRDSLQENKPELLQKSFVEDLQNGVNDKFTKSDAYFITHRYFDNGGNIYEIYDYVESHPDLAFLKDAEKIYPGAFEQIKNRSIPLTYSALGMHVLLAYLETLDKNGYADIAALGTTANQYAKLAYFLQVGPKKSQLLKDTNVISLVKTETERSILFTKKTKDILVKLLAVNNLTANDFQNPTKLLTEVKEVKGLDTLPHNFLVGLNQYASALRYLEATGFDIKTIGSPLSAQDIFAFNGVFAKKYVPELEVFTSLLNASTLSLVSPDDVSGIRSALQPVLDFKVKKKQNLGMVSKILSARLEEVIYTPGTRVRVFYNLDLYGLKNIGTLGNTVPEFKAWLIANGWQESDFQLN